MRCSNKPAHSHLGTWLPDYYEDLRLLVSALALRRYLAQLGQLSLTGPEGFVLVYEKMASGMASKRLMKELSKIQGDGLPPGITLVASGQEGKELSDWLFDIRVLDANPIYLNQVYRLKFRFPKAYPIEPPEVTFEKEAERPIPVHPHVYSNGIICLDLLGTQGWSPVQSAQSVCMSIQSMLTSNTKNERPPGDEEFVKGNKQRPRDIEFMYDDNTV